MSSHPKLPIVGLHVRIDEAAADIEQKNASRLVCKKGCFECCTDDLTVFEVEAERIKANHQQLLKEGAPHPEGACAFLDAAGACRIYADRPYVCRTQGLPLRWIDEDEDGQLVDLRDICHLNEPGGPPLEELLEEECWSIGPFEEQLARLQQDSGGGLARVRLRDLFSR